MDSNIFAPLAVLQEDKEFRENENAAAKLIAAVVRNQMEEFHGKYLSDEQMEELNPIIRNAIYTALIHIRDNPDAMRLYAHLHVPEYWEDCEYVKI